METTSEPLALFSLVPGQIGVAFDGVTVSRKLKNLYTVSEAPRNMF